MQTEARRRGDAHTICIQHLKIYNLGVPNNRWDKSQQGHSGQHSLELTHSFPDRAGLTCFCPDTLILSLGMDKKSEDPRRGMGF